MFMIVLPFLGVLTYLIAQHDGIVERNSKRAEVAQAQFDDRVRSVAHSDGNGIATEIEKAEQLLSRGTISRTEFETLKAKALTGH